MTPTNASVSGRGAESGQVPPPFLLLRASGPGAVLGPGVVAGIERTLARVDAGYRTATVVIDATEPVPAALWERLASHLDALRRQGARRVRLVASGAGRSDGARPALAQRIANRWGLGVIAPDGSAVVAPGGLLFCSGRAQAGGWKLFKPATPLTGLGPRHPAPAWQPMTELAPARTPSGLIVEQIPAGLLLRQPGRTPPLSADVTRALRVDPERPVLVIGLPGGPAPRTEHLLAEEVAGVLAGQGAVRLVSGTGVDVLPVAQEVCDALGIEIEVLTALPVAGVGPGAPDLRPQLLNAAGEVTWAPYVQSVVCRPAGAALEPQLGSWHSPLPGGHRAGADGVVPLTDGWQVTVTRAGLCVAPVGRTVPVAARPVDPERLVVEVAPAQAPANEAGCRAVGALLAALPAEVRRHVSLLALGRRAPAELTRLHGLAAEHGVRFDAPDRNEGRQPRQQADVPATDGPGPAGPTAGPDPLRPYRAYFDRASLAVRDGAFEKAMAVTADLEAEVLARHGEHSLEVLHARQLRAQVARIAGQDGQAAELYAGAALMLLAIPETALGRIEKAAANAEACWRSIRDPAEAIRVAPVLVELRRQVPGADGRLLRAAQEYRDQLHQRVVPPPAVPPLPAQSQPTSQPAPAAHATAAPRGASGAARTLTPELLKQMAAGSRRQPPAGRPQTPQQAPDTD